MKKIIVICFLIVAAGNCFGQQITFQKTFGGMYEDRAWSAQQTMDGGYIIAGHTLSFGMGSMDVYLIKTDTNGDSLWIKTFGESGADYGFSIQQTTDSGYIIIGYTHNSFGLDSGDVYLIKLDVNGNPDWSKTFGGTGEEWGRSGQQTMDGGYIIVGYTASFGAGDFDVYLIKTDANGDLVWTKTFGGTDEDYGFSVQQTTDGGYIIAGYTSSFGAGSQDIYMIRTNSNGDSLWTKTFGGTNQDEAFSVQQTTDGGFIITGYTWSFGAGNSDCYLIKTDVNGDLLWSKTFGNTGSDLGYSVQPTTDGGYIITGHNSGSGGGFTDAYLIKTDANGSVLWTKSYGGATVEYGNTIRQTTDGGYIIAGFGFGPSNYEVYLIKTDSLGNSGCNESSTAIIVTTLSTQVTSPSTIVTSPATMVTTPTTLVGFGATVTTLCTSVGILSAIPNPLPAITIYPNPTTNNFTITFPNTINKGVIEIYNVLGKNIFNENISNVSQKEIHLKNTVAGIYFVKVKNGEKEHCLKLIVQ